MVDLYTPDGSPVTDRRSAVPSELSTLVSTIQTLVGTVNHHETRLAVIETRQEAQGDRLSTIEQDVRETKKGVEKVLDRLTTHTAQEDKDRQKLLFGVVTTLISVLGAIGWEFLVKPFLAGR